MATESETGRPPVSSAPWRSFRGFTRDGGLRNTNVRLDPVTLATHSVEMDNERLLPGRASTTELDKIPFSRVSRQNGLRTKSAKMIGETQLPPLQPRGSRENIKPVTEHQGWFRKRSTKYIRAHECESTPDVPLVARTSDVWLPNKEIYSQAGMDLAQCILPSEILDSLEQMKGDVFQSPWFESPHGCEECSKDDSQQCVSLQIRVDEGRVRVHLEVLCRHKLYMAALPRLLPAGPTDVLESDRKVHNGGLGWLLQWFTLCTHPHVQV